MQEGAQRRWEDWAMKKYEAKFKEWQAGNVMRC